MIGIDANTGLLYEGQTFYGHGVWPKPLLLAATLLDDEQGWPRIPQSGNLQSAGCVFREDYFDPVSRIRRGRFYDRNQTSVVRWWVYPHPAGMNLVASKNSSGQHNLELQTYVPKRLPVEFIQRVPASTVVLGAQPSVTAWTVVAVERDGANEDFVTLKARLNFGLLPELVLEAIPAAGRERVVHEIGKVVDAAHRQSGISLVDLCRAAITVVIAEWLVGKGASPDVRSADLAPLVKKLPESAGLWRSATEIIRLLHTRGKPNFQAANETRDVSEADGACALEALALMLREFGWAR